MKLNGYDWYLNKVEQSGELLYEKRYTTSGKDFKRCTLKIFKYNGKYYRKHIVDGSVRVFEEMPERDVYTVLMGVHHDVTDKEVHEVLEKETTK